MNSLLASLNLQVFINVAILAAIIQFLLYLLIHKDFRANINKKYIKYRYNTKTPEHYLNTKKKFYLYGRKIKRNDYLSFNVKVKATKEGLAFDRTVSGFVIGMATDNKIVIKEQNYITYCNTEKIAENNIHMLNDELFKDIKKEFGYITNL